MKEDITGKRCPAGESNGDSKKVLRTGRFTFEVAECGARSLRECLTNLQASYIMFSPCI